MSRHRLTTIMAVFFCLIAGIFMVDTLDMPKDAYQLPRLLIYLVAILSIGTVWESYKKDKVEAAAEKAEQAADRAVVGPGEKANDRAEIVRLSVFVVLIAAYVLLMKPVGYFIMTPLFIIGSFLLLKSAKLLASVLTAVGFSVFVYLLFVLFLRLPVPMGILSGAA